MLWVDYHIETAGGNFRIIGDYPEEVMGKTRDGEEKENYIYKPGDRFIVDEDGWLRKVEVDK